MSSILESFQPIDVGILVDLKGNVKLFRKFFKQKLEEEKEIP